MSARATTISRETRSEAAAHRTRRAAAWVAGLAACLALLAPAAAQAQGSGEIFGWGYDADSGGSGSWDFGPTSPFATKPRGVGYTAIAAGQYHSLAVTDYGSVVTWGTGYSSEYDVPFELTSHGHTKATAVAAGDGHSLALIECYQCVGKVAAWGLNPDGQTDVPPGATSGVTAIAAGGNHSLALKDNGSVVAWGANGSGQTDVPAAASTGVKAIAAGSDHSLALKEDGSVVAWGFGGHGQTTVPAAASAGVQAISAGGHHSLALQEDGSVVAWGANGSGEATVPAAASAGVKAISGGAVHNLALKEDASVVAWGNNDHTRSTVPAGLNEIEAIAAGGHHSLALSVPTPPGGVDFLRASADASGGRASLSWENPTDGDYVTTRVLRSTTGAASTPEPSASQTQVYEGPGQSFEDTGLTNGQTYTYTAFARDDAGLWSSRRTVRVTPADTAAPGAPVIASPADNSYDTDGSFAIGGTAEPAVTVRVYEGPTLKGTASASDSGAWSVSVSGVAGGSHRYTATATDAAGNASSPSLARTVIVDKVKPTVTTLSPASGVTGVAPTANVLATFSEAMQASTVSKTTVKLVRRGTTAAIPATVTYSASARRATLNPTATLAAGTTYTATVTTAARDTAGNPLAATRSWSFTTRR